VFIPSTYTVSYDPTGLNAQVPIFARILLKTILIFFFEFAN